MKRWVSGTSPWSRWIPIVRAWCWGGAAGIALGAVDATAQEFPTADELDALQAEAEVSPLFASDEPLVLELTVDVDYLRDERPDEEEIDGLLRFRNPEGRWMDTAIEVRTRGIFRRESRNCSMPPLRLDVPRGRMEGTVFHGQDKLKLVFPCRPGRGEYQKYVLREYLAYRMLNLLTPVSHRVRLVDLTIRDTSRENDPMRHYGFLIEHEDALMARTRSVLSEWEGQFYPGGLEVEQATIVSLFQFLIGNTDWSSIEFHNTILVWDDQGRYLTVPYDFDFSGIVEASYASPAEQLPIRTVRERLYWGFCWEGIDHEALVGRFVAARPAVDSLWREFEFLEEGDRNRGLDYIELFYRIIQEPATYRRQVVEACRRIPGSNP